MLFHCQFLLVESLRQHFDQLHQDIGLSLGRPVKSTGTKMLNQHPMFDLIGYQIEEVKRLLSHLAFMRGKTAKQLIRQDAKIGLNQSRNQGYNLHK